MMGSPDDTLLALVLTEALQVATPYVPFLNPVFRTAPLSPMELGVAVAASSVVFWVFEADRLVRRLRVTTPAPGEEV